VLIMDKEKEYNIVMACIMAAVAIAMLVGICNARKLGDSAEIASSIFNIDSIQATSTDNLKPHCLMFTTMWKGTGLVDTSINKHLELYKIYGWRDTVSVAQDGSVFTGKELCLDTADRDEERTCIVYEKFDLTKKQADKLQAKVDSCFSIVALESDLTNAQRNHFRLKTKHYKGMGNVRLRNQGRRVQCPS
jgi:hypothetical protein